MKDSPGHGRNEWGERDSGYSGYSDPAYASQTPYGPPYQPTERLPAYPPYGYNPTADPNATGQYPPQYPPHGPGPDPPQDPKSPRWLWIVAGVAVVMVIGLVIALVIVNSSRQETVVAPLPAAPEPSMTTSSPRSPTTTSRAPRTTTRPTTPLLPLPTLPSTTPDPTTPGATDSVIYTVEGLGRAINLTYVDTGGLLQTEFNVMLPWTKEVALPRPGESSASITIINVGREVTCSITVNGTQRESRTGAGLTICAPTR